MTTIVVAIILVVFHVHTATVIKFQSLHISLETERMLKLGIGNSVRKAARFMKYYDGAQHYFNRTKELEIQFSMTPHFKLIEEMMDLMRTVSCIHTIYKRIPTYLPIFIHTCIVYVCIDTINCMYLYIHKHIHTEICKYAMLYIHKCIYTYMHVYILHVNILNPYLHTYFQAVELFDAANDKSYNDVVLYIRNFLQRPTPLPS